MDLTPEQQAQLALQEAIESPRRAHEAAMEKRRSRLEMIRLAKETLIENSRNKPTDSRDVLAEDIKEFASKLEAYIEG